MPYVIAIIILLFVISLIITYWQVTLLLVTLALLAVFTPRVIRTIRKNRYFAGDQFQTHKNQLATFVAEHNDVASYTTEIRDRGAFEFGASSTGAYAHLATSQNTSQHNYRRDRHVATYEPHIHNCSLQVVRNAEREPIKYLTKYFGIKADEAHLADVERVGQDIARLEGAVANLHEREHAITTSFNPPPFIIKHYADEFMAQVGVTLSPIAVPYPQYAFEYVSAGGNSSQRTPITLNTPTIDALVENLSQRIRFRQSAAGQRALMTARLRESIKMRDNYACKQCSISIAAEPHLLLEIDHITPVSRGGLTTETNLQTLCWKCNRTKFNRMPTG